MTDPSKPTIEELIKGLGDLSNGRIQLQTDNKRLEERVAELTRQLAASQGTNQRQPVTQEQLEAATAECDALRARVAEVTAECDNLKSALEIQNASVKELEAEVGKLQTENEGLRTDLGELSTAAQNLIHPQPATQPSPLEILDELLEEPPSPIEASPKTRWRDRRTAAREKRSN